MVTNLRNEYLTVKINHQGAELCSLKRTDSETEYIWQGDPKFWTRHAPVLFPIVGRLKNDRYAVFGQDYELSQHGFARDLLYREVSSRPDYAAFEVSASAKTLTWYPFHFRLEISYSLLEGSLCVRYSVENKDERQMFFSIGGHPAFNCPIKAGELFEDYQLAFEKPETADRHFLEAGLFSGKTVAVLDRQKALRLSSGLFEQDAIVLKDLVSDSVTLKHKTGSSSVRLDFAGFPFFGVWSKPCASFVCLEPWFGLADRDDATGLLYEKEGIQALEPESVFECQYHITVT